MTDDYVLARIAGDPERLAVLLAAQTRAASAAPTCCDCCQPDCPCCDAACDGGACCATHNASEPESGADRSDHSEEPALATPERASNPTPAKKPRPISRDDFVAQLQERNRTE